MRGIPEREGTPKSKRKRGESVTGAKEPAVKSWGIAGLPGTVGKGLGCSTACSEPRPRARRAGHHQASAGHSGVGVPHDNFTKNRYCIPITRVPGVITLQQRSTCDWLHAQRSLSRNWMHCIGRTKKKKQGSKHVCEGRNALRARWPLQRARSTLRGTFNGCSAHMKQTSYAAFERRYLLSAEAQGREQRACRSWRLTG